MTDRMATVPSAAVTSPEGSSALDQRTVQHHQAPDTRSRIHFGTLLAGRASSVYRGMIRMDQGAIRSDAYQKNDNLILEPGPRARAIPKLEILADDVKCSHGSTVGRLSREDLFYMASRGIRPPEVRLLIADGFIRSRVLAAGGCGPLVERLQDFLRERVLRIREDEGGEDEDTEGQEGGGE